MFDLLRAVARRVLAPAARHRIYAGYAAYWEWWKERLRPRRGRFVETMAAAQHIDFDQVEGLISPADGVVVDVGAERGEVSRFFLRLGFEVVALEPEQENFRVLSRIRDKKFMPLRVACADRSGAATLEVRAGTYYHRLAHGDVGGTTQHVKVVALDDLIAQYKILKIALLKVDVEGSELAVLDGLISRSHIVPEVIVVEFTQATVRELLQRLQPRYVHMRFCCRWDELPGQSSQIRFGVFDGPHPLVFDATWGNLICTNRSFRILHPLVSTDVSERASMPR